MQTTNTLKTRVPDCSSEKVPDFKYVYTHCGYLLSQNLTSINTIIHKYCTLLTESNTVEEDRLGIYILFTGCSTSQLFKQREFIQLKITPFTYSTQ